MARVFPFILKTKHKTLYDKQAWAKLEILQKKYELGLAKIGKGRKSKNMALKVKVKMMRMKIFLRHKAFQKKKKIIKNANVKIIEKEPKKYGFTWKKSLDKPNKENKECGQKTNIPSSPKCFGCQGYGHMK